MAADLARRTGMGLRVVNVVRPISPRPHYIPVEVDSWEIDSILSDTGRAAAEAAWEKITKLIAQVSGGIACQGNVIESSTVAEAIAADATAHGGALIVVGAAPSPHRFVPRGISTPLSLMATAVVPVLTVRQDCGLSFSKDSLKILIADDLTVACEPAVRAAMSLAQALGRTEVVHTHVIDFTFTNLVRRLEEQRRQKGPEQQKPAELWSTMEQRVHESLRARVGQNLHAVEATGGRYETQVMSGNPRDEITSSLTHFAPDMAVFGRHHLVHRRPFGIGHVPFSAMLAGNWGVVVAGEA